MRSYVAKGASYASRKWAGHGWACGLPQAFPLWLGRRLVQPWGCIICFLLLLWQITTRVATTQTVTLQCRRSEVWYRSHWVKIKGAELPPFFAGSRGESVSFRPPASRGLLLPWLTAHLLHFESQQQWIQSFSHHVSLTFFWCGLSVHIQ